MSNQRCPVCGGDTRDCMVARTWAEEQIAEAYVVGYGKALGDVEEQLSALTAWRVRDDGRVERVDTDPPLIDRAAALGALKELDALKELGE